MTNFLKIFFSQKKKFFFWKIFRPRLRPKFLKCHILLAARILRKFFPKKFFIHFLCPNERFKNYASLFRRDSCILREPIPHSTSLKISIFRPFLAYLGHNLTFLRPLKPSEGGFLTLFLGYLDTFEAQNTWKKWFELSEISNLSQILAKKIEKKSKNLVVEKSSNKYFFFSNLNFRPYSWSLVSNTNPWKVCVGLKTWK